MTDHALPRPNGLFETFRAKLARAWSSAHAEQRWDFSSEEDIPFEPRIVAQDFEVILLARAGEEPDHLMTCLISQTWSIDAWIRKVEHVHDSNRNALLSRAGTTGLTLDGAFYPHSRIDRIVPGALRVIQEGSKGA